MTLSTTALVWLFPVVFMIHDFEELLLFEPWLRRRGGEISARIAGRLPNSVTRRVDAILQKSTLDFAFPVSLIFLLTALSAFLAAEMGIYGPFLVASGLFFAHAFLHIGQAVLLRGYVPALITSVLVAIPYGLILFPRLLAEGYAAPLTLAASIGVGAVLAAPFILAMHAAGEWFQRRVARRLRG